MKDICLSFKNAHRFTIFALTASLCPLSIGQDMGETMESETEAPDIVKSVTYDLGDHLVEFQEVTDLSLPTPPSKEAVAEPQQLTAEQRAQLSAWLAEQPKLKSHVMAATVYRSSSHLQATLLTCFSSGGEEPAHVWSSIDWNLMRGGRFTLPDGNELQLLLLVSTIDVDQTRASYAARGGTYVPPVIPSFPGEGAGYQVVSGTLPTNLKADLDALHEIHDRDYTQLVEANRVRKHLALAAKQAAAERAALPPPDLVIRYRVMTQEELMNK